MLEDLNEWQKGYIAGIIDGEGCITAYKYRSRGREYIKGTIVVTNSNHIIPKTLMEWIGVGTLVEHSKKRHQKLGWKLQLAWKVDSTKNSAKILKELLPYLRAKRRQAELIIELAEIQSRSNPRINGRYNLKRQEEIVREIRELNKRGLK